MQILAHYNDRAYLLLAAIFVVGLASILVLSWRDSIQLLSELLSPLKKLARLRFRLLHLVVAMAGISVAVKLATLWLCANSNWLDTIGLATTISLVFSLLACVIWISYVDIFGRRRSLRSDVNVKLPTADAKPRQEKQAGRKIRFPETKRQITVFKR